MILSSDLLGKTVFLSSSFPLEEGVDWERDYLATINPGLVIQGVKAVLRAVFLRKGAIVFGGHPGITPFVLEISKQFEEQLGGKFVKIYQSKLFEKHYTNEAKLLRQLTYVDFVEINPVNDDREQSLKEMRTRMFLDNRPAFSVFIGGREGIIDEFDLFHELLPQAGLYPIAASGGAARKLLDSDEDISRTSILRKLGIGKNVIEILNKSQGMPFVIDKIISDYLTNRT